MRKDQNGYIVVETIGCFVLFVMLMGAILSLINVVTLQARVHYAITQAAQTLSMYCYSLEVAGAADEIMHISSTNEKVEAEADELKGSINGVIDGLLSLSPDQLGAGGNVSLDQLSTQVETAVDQVGTSGEAAIDQVSGWAESAASDPTAAVQTVIQYGLGEIGKLAFEELVLQPLVGRYLTNGSMSGDAYLKMFGVEDGINGLQFHDPSLLDLTVYGNNDSVLLTSDGNVKICVSYNISLRFFDAVIPFAEPKLHITQEAVTKAWLGGREPESQDEN